MIDTHISPETVDALKPCPFCGEEQIFLNEPNKSSSYGSINCPACLAIMPGECSDQTELIAAWNQRSVDVAQAPTVDDPMSEHTPMPKLVMGHICVMTPDDGEGIPYDEAVIHLEGDEDSEIEVRCPAALRVAPLIVKAVNNHDALVKALQKIADLVDSEAGEQLDDAIQIANTALGLVGQQRSGS